MYHEVLTGQRLVRVRAVENVTSYMWPTKKWYNAKPQYKAAAEVCNNLLKIEASARPSAHAFLESIVLVLPK